MALFLLDETLLFPPVELSEPDGLLAVGGDLSVERLLQAYRHGIFPWYDEPPIAWWCPDPRCVLFPENLVVHKSMRPVLNGRKFEFRVNTAFEQVIRQCMLVPRAGQSGTWINEEVITAYSRLHALGLVHSAETWQEGRLVGGLYGVRLGKVFFGESMFSTVSNASKFAFIKWVQQLVAEDIRLIDCQVYTEHLFSLGASLLPRRQFIDLLNQWC